MAITLQDMINTQNDINNHRVVDEYAPQLVEGEIIFNRDVNLLWFAPVAANKNDTTLFDPAKLLNAEQLKRAKTYKALELAYLRLSRGSDDDSFVRKMGQYQARYNAEIQMILKSGLSYDWNGSGDIQQVETSVKRSRRTISRV